jgi:hypothetical protein
LIMSAIDAVLRYPFHMKYAQDRGYCFTEN